MEEVKRQLRLGSEKKNNGVIVTGHKGVNIN